MIDDILIPVLTEAVNGVLTHIKSVKAGDPISFPKFRHPITGDVYGLCDIYRGGVTYVTYATKEKDGYIVGDPTDFIYVDTKRVNEDKLEVVGYEVVVIKPKVNTP